MKGKWVSEKEAMSYFNIDTATIRRLLLLKLINVKTSGGRTVFWVSDCTDPVCKKDYHINCIPMACCNIKKCAVPYNLCDTCKKPSHSPCEKLKHVSVYDKNVCDKCYEKFHERLEKLVADLGFHGVSFIKDRTKFCNEYLLLGIWGNSMTVRLTCQIKYMKAKNLRYPLKNYHHEQAEYTRCYNGINSWPWMKHRAAATIQRKMMDWLYKPYTKDGKIGLMPSKIHRDLKELGYIK
jgi:hypothetical protein